MYKHTYLTGTDGKAMNGLSRNSVTEFATVMGTINYISEWSQN